MVIVSLQKRELMLTDLFKDKTIKNKELTTRVADMLLDNSLSIEELIAFAATAKDPVNATCIESMEYASSKKPELMTEAGLAYTISMLGHKAPRVKWESAKVIGNTIKLFTKHVPEAVQALMVNTTEDSGTVVRWAAAFALGEIVKLNTEINTSLIPAVENIMALEEKNSIKKIYASALPRPAKKKK